MSASPRIISQRRFTQPFKAYRVVVTNDQYKAIRISSMKMRGFSHPFERDLDTNEIVIYGRNEKLIRQDIKTFIPHAEIIHYFSKNWRYDR